MNLEKFLFKKISLWILLLTIILSLIFAIWFGSLVTRSRTAFQIATVVDTLQNIFSNAHSIAVKEKRFDEKTGLNFYLPISGYKYLLLSRYDGNLDRSVVELVSLEQKKVIHEWKPKIDKINSYSKLPDITLDLKTDHNEKRYMITHPFLTTNGELLIHSVFSPLTKVDMCSKFVWSLDYVFHHSIEKDHENNLWIPFNYTPKIEIANKWDKKFDIIGKYFHAFHTDDGIMKISNDGKILFNKSIIQIFLDNNLEELIFSNDISQDPIHLNDIQPVLFDGPYFKKGDIFLSFRTNHMIVLYRPSTNKIIWYKEKPWAYQHDVDVINKNQISIFNNKFRAGARKDEHNNVLIYDFNKDMILNNYDGLFKKYDIRTPFEGRSEIMNDGSIFVEETNFGRLMQINSEGDLIWEYINRANDGKLYPLGWSRILKQVNNSFLEKIKISKCDEK